MKPPPRYARYPRVPSALMLSECNRRSYLVPSTCAATKSGLAEKVATSGNTPCFHRLMSVTTRAWVVLLGEVQYISARPVRTGSIQRYISCGVVLGVYVATRRGLAGVAERCEEALCFYRSRPESAPHPPHV